MTTRARAGGDTGASRKAIEMFSWQHRLTSSNLRATPAENTGFVEWPKSDDFSPRREGTEEPMHIPERSAQCGCSVCSKVFSSISGFDMHRVGPHDERRRCLTSAEIEAKGYIEIDGIWRRDV